MGVARPWAWGPILAVCLVAVAAADDVNRAFSVRQLQICGNELIATEQLLQKLLLTHRVSSEVDGRRAELVYDFQVVHDLVREPGAERTVSLKTIQGLTTYILSVYREHGYAGIYVYVPAQAVKGQTFVDGILPVRVLEGKIAPISVGRYDFERRPQEEGFLKSAVLEAWSPVQTGQVIQQRQLDEFVRLLNLNPDRHVAAVVSRSAKPNALNLIFDGYETSPWHAYVQADNSGTNDRQWSPKVGLVNTNLTGSDDRFSTLYQAPWEKSMEEEDVVFGSYDPTGYDQPDDSSIKTRMIRLFIHILRRQVGPSRPKPMGPGQKNARHRNIRSL